MRVVAKGGTVRTVGGAIRRMRAVKAEVGPVGHCYHFTGLYVTITQAVDRAIKGDLFADDEFLTRLDVVFANRFFEALRAVDDPDVITPAAWLELFKADLDGGYPLPVQLACAGVNAHIQYDLPIAVVDTCLALNRPGIKHGSQRVDYLAVNKIFEEQMGELMARFNVPFHQQQRVQELGNRLVELFRDRAWEVAEELWALRHDEGVRRKREEELSEEAADWTRALVWELFQADPPPTLNYPFRTP